MAQKIQKMQTLDRFEGKAAESIKTSFSEVHLFFLEATGGSPDRMRSYVESICQWKSYAMWIFLLICQWKSYWFARALRRGQEYIKGKRRQD